MTGSASGVKVKLAGLEGALAALALLLTIAGLSGAAEASSGCPNRAASGFRAALPDCRSYELVSPSYKESFPFSPLGISEEGTRVGLESFGSFLTPEGTIPIGTGVFGNTYRAVRSESGWTSAPVDAPFSRLPDIDVTAMSLDAGSSIWFARAPGQSAADPYLDPPAGEPARMGPGAPPGTRETTLDLAGESADLSYALFMVQSGTMGEERLWPGDTTFGERRRSLYEYVGTGNAEPTLVGVRNEGRLEGKPNVNDGAELVSRCGTVLGGLPEGNAYNAISSSGATVFFTAEECGGSPPVNEVYARFDQERLIAISEPPLPPSPSSVPGRECTGTCALAESVPGNRSSAAFAGASLDGSRVFFSTSQPLVNADTDGGPDLYEEDISEGRVTRLAQVSRGDEGDPTPGSGAGVLGVARISQDGSHVYYVATGVLTGANSEGRAPLAGKPNLYVSVRECAGGEASCGESIEHTSFVATLSNADSADWGSPDFRPVQATPEGRFLVFQSTADLTPDEEGQKEAGQVFEYDAQTGVLARVSRGQGGYGEDGNSSEYRATIPVQGYGGDSPSTRFTNLAVSADGSRVFFTSAAALTPQALKGFASVYEYHDGQVALISDGNDVITVEGKAVTKLIGTDESGKDVFFMTAGQLVPQDRNTSADLYDARSEGGFAPPAPSAPCLGASCQGAGSAPPALLAPGVSSGAGQAVAPPTASAKGKVTKKKTRKPKPKKRRRSARTHGRGKGARTAGRGRKP